MCDKRYSATSTARWLITSGCVPHLSPVLFNDGIAYVFIVFGSWMLLQVYCLSWNLVKRNVFLSGSWDDTIKLWDMNSPASLATFKEHTYCVYAANWCDIRHRFSFAAP